MRCRLSEIMHIIGGGTPKTSIAKYWGGKIPWLSVKDFNNDNRYVYETEKTITEEGLNHSSTTLLQKDDVIISARGTVGELAMIPFPMAFNQSCYGLRAREEIVDSTFLYYLLKHNVRILRKNTHGTVFDTITKDTFADIEIDIPDIDTQKKISAILSPLDDKIELNRRINDNLEQQARAIFKHWFIDSETGGKTGTFSDLIEAVISGDWGKDSQSGKNSEAVYCIRGADIPEVKTGGKGKMPVRYIPKKNYDAKRLMPGDIVIEISGGSPTQSTGRAAAISQSLLDRYDRDMICTNFCRALKPKAGYSMFTYYYLQYLYSRNIFFVYENGTTGIKNLDLSSFMTYEEIIIPPAELVRKFDDFCQNVFDVIFSNGRMNETLAKIRDSLIPKLISEEADLKNFPSC